MNNVSFSQIKGLVDNIPKDEHHLFYHGNEFKNSPYSIYRNAIFSSPDKTYGAFIEIYNLDKSNPHVGYIVIAATPDARGKGYTDKLIKDAIKAMPSIGVNKLYWKCANNNDYSYHLALRNGFKEDKRYSKEKLLTYVVESQSLSNIINSVNESKDDSFLYHGSQKKFDVLKVRNSGYSGKHAFATNNYAFALAYAGKQWSDFEINQSRIGDIIYLTEIIPGKLREIFNVNGYIHIVSKEYFKPFHGVEYITDRDVPVIKTVYIPNVLDALKENPNIRIFSYPYLPEFIPSREKYLISMSKKYGNHDITKLMNFIKV